MMPKPGDGEKQNTSHPQRQRKQPSRGHPNRIQAHAIACRSQNSPLLAIKHNRLSAPAPANSTLNDLGIEVCGGQSSGCQNQCAL